MRIAVPAISVMSSLLLRHSADNDLMRKVGEGRQRWLHRKLGVNTRAGIVLRTLFSYFTYD